jgi:hypothetical protein
LGLLRIGDYGYTTTMKYTTDYIKSSIRMTNYKECNAFAASADLARTKDQFAFCVKNILENAQRHQTC